MKSRSPSQSSQWLPLTLLEAIEIVTREMKRLGMDPTQTRNAVFAAPSRRVQNAAFAVFISRSGQTRFSGSKFFVHADRRVEFTGANEAH